VQPCLGIAGIDLIGDSPDLRDAGGVCPSFNELGGVRRLDRSLDPLAEESLR
jgi:hypothetical protein